MDGNWDAEGKQFFRLLAGLNIFIINEISADDLFFLFFWKIIDEVTNACNEIVKNEKEMTMIAIVAQTLLERTSEL